MIWERVELLFNTIADWVYRNKLNHVYASWPVIKDLSKNNYYEPISLQNIAAAGSINKLSTLESYELLNVFNIVKDKQIFVRAGPYHERKLNNFCNIVKNFIYKKDFVPLAPLEYFENVTLNPAPFCIHCGIFKKIEKSMCWCLLCNFLRFAGLFTMNKIRNGESRLPVHLDSHWML